MVSKCDFGMEWLQRAVWDTDFRNESGMMWFLEDGLGMDFRNDFGMNLNGFLVSLILQVKELIILATTTKPSSKYI